MNVSSIFFVCMEMLSKSSNYNNSSIFLNQFIFQVKFLKSKPGTAMVQMGDAMAVDRAIAGLTGMRFFDEKLALA